MRPERGRLAPIEVVRDILTCYRQGSDKAALNLWHSVVYFYGRAEARMLLQAVCMLDSEDHPTGWDMVQDVENFLRQHAPATLNSTNLQEV